MSELIIRKRNSLSATDQHPFLLVIRTFDSLGDSRPDYTDVAPITEKVAEELEYRGLARFLYDKERPNFKHLQRKK